MKFCTNCGSQIPEGSNYCTNCGASITNESGVVNNTPVNNSGPKFPIENRNIALCVVLSMLTCAIYGIVWFIKMVNDVNTVCNDDKSNQSGGTVFLLSLITCGIYELIWFYNAGKRLNTFGNNNNIKIEDNSILYIVFFLLGLGIIDYCLIQSDLNKLSAQ